MPGFYKTQNNFLMKAKENETLVTVYITNGFQTKGRIVSFDDTSILLSTDNGEQLFFKHAISTISPTRSPSTTNSFHQEHRVPTRTSPYAVVDRPDPLSRKITVKIREPWMGKLMQEAVNTASDVAKHWRSTETGEELDFDLLHSVSTERDTAAFPDLGSAEFSSDIDSDSYYIVSPDGAVGRTEDGGSSIKWLFTPVGVSITTLPRSWHKDTPWSVQ